MKKKTKNIPSLVYHHTICIFLNILYTIDYIKYFHSIIHQSYISEFWALNLLKKSSRAQLVIDCHYYIIIAIKSVFQTVAGCSFLKYIQFGCDITFIYIYYVSKEIHVHVFTIVILCWIVIVSMTVNKPVHRVYVECKGRKKLSQFIASMYQIYISTYSPLQHHEMGSLSTNNLGKLAVWP